MPDQAVIDTTGSVVYVGQEILDLLKAKTLVVYLEASAGAREQLFQIFMDDPKPVVWGDAFTAPSGQPHELGLYQSYPKLLAYRASQYAAFADITMPYDVVRGAGSADEFLRVVGEALLPNVAGDV